MGKRVFGGMLLLLSLAMLFWNGEFVLTGNFIKDYFQSYSLINVFGLVLFISSILIFVSKKSLEAIIVPTGGSPEVDKDRAKAGREYSEKKETQYFIISGGRGSEPLGKSGRANIYKELRETEKLKHSGKESKVKPSNIIVEGNSRDSVENVIYSLKKLKKGTAKIDFVSYPLHLARFKYIMKKAKEENYAPKDLEVGYIPTKQNFGDLIYGTLGYVKERWRLRKGIDYALNHKTGKFGNFLKKLVG